jgi:hypothetical protein
MKEKMLAGLERDKMAAKVRAAQNSVFCLAAQAIACDVPG